MAEKARQVAQIINSSREAAALARATIPPPAGEAAAARELAFGAIQAGAVAASAFTGAQKGGKVGGGKGRGDKHPYMLEEEEIIIPQRYSQTFEQLYKGFPGVSDEGEGGSDRNISVEIMLNDEASRILTLNQREDKALGIGR